MTLQKVVDCNVSRLDIVKSKDKQYIREGLKSLELQTDWITLGKYPLPSTKFVKNTDTSMSLTIPLDEKSSLYEFFNTLDTFVESKNLIPNKSLNKFIKRKDDNIFLKMKLYITTHIFLDKNTQPEINHSIQDFYKYFKEYDEIRIIFSIGKLYEINQEYGFTPYAMRIQIKQSSINEIQFMQSDTENSNDT